MGCCNSKTKVEGLPTDNLGSDFTREEWEKVHGVGTVEVIQDYLNSKAVDVTKLDLTSEGAKPAPKSLFICCNTYTTPSYKLGVGPLNDAETIGTYLYNNGYKVYYAHNPKSTEYKDYIKFFVENTTGTLVLYYTGHGSSVNDQDENVRNKKTTGFTNEDGINDEEDGKDEAFVFDDDIVIDDELAEILADCEKPSTSKVVMINDCCHSGTVWDLSSNSYRKRKIPANIMSLSAACDSQTSKQTSVGGKDQGIFTYYFFFIAKSSPAITPNEMKKEIDKYIVKFEQEFQIHATSKGMLDKPIFLS